MIRAGLGTVPFVPGQVVPGPGRPGTNVWTSIDPRHGKRSVLCLPGLLGASRIYIFPVQVYSAIRRPVKKKSRF
jgi:hypothetical protein